MFFLMSFYLFNLNIMFWLLSMNYLLNNKTTFMEWNLYMINSLKIEFIMFMDWMSLIFISTVMLISSIVIIYSINYMHSDLFMKRFMMLILIFVMSMIFMIISPNLMSILLGWDGLGLSSYCLVAYYQNKKSFNASMITILMNRIGDIILLMSISILMFMGSWNFLFFKKINQFMILIMIIAFTKSAQIPFSSWLPMAMAAPTPISSLVHSSTLVTAGVYLLIRFNFLFNKNLLFFMFIMSCFTMFMAGMTANFEFDLKKIIALSTLSQLGLMISSISLNMTKLAFFHLITHAMFKSLLFLCSGIMIHNYFNNQDIRFISMINLNKPFINLIFNIASLTLSGMPFLSGFYSKDLIIENFLMNNNNYIMFIMMFMSMSMTISYTFRLFFYLSIKNLKLSMMNFYQSFNLMNYSIIILLMMSMFYGSILNWLIFNSLNNIFLPKNLKLIIYLFLTSGLMLGMFNSTINFKLFKNKFIKNNYKFINMMFMLPLIFKKNKMNIFNFNNKLIFISDNSWLEFLSSKKFLIDINLLYKKKKLMEMNFILMMTMIIYFTIMMFMF